MFLFRLKMGMDLCLVSYFQENIKIFAFPVLPNLKQLILKVGAWNDDSLLEFTSLIKACPNLNRFVLQVCL